MIRCFGERSGGGVALIAPNANAPVDAGADRVKWRVVQFSTIRPFTRSAPASTMANLKAFRNRTMSAKILILGGGQAAMQAAMSLRDLQFDGAITLVSEEPELPYKRPPLSKGFLKGDTREDALVVRFPGYFDEQRIGLHRGAAATQIDRAAKQVKLATGQVLDYDQLVLATGTRVRKLDLPGADFAGITYLRTLADARALKALLPQAQNVSIIGGGFIGLEFAAVAARAGKKVTVIEAVDRLMARAVGPLVSGFFLDQHRRNGVDIRLSTQIAGFEGDAGQVRAIRLADGGTLPTDLVLAGIGVIPNTEIAATAGLPCDNGVMVDARLCTADPNIYAIGDIARFPTRFATAPVRLESVQNAIDHGKHAAAAVMGSDAPYAAVPWFWTEQYEAMLQMAGLNTGFDEEVLRGDSASGSFSVDYRRSGKLVGVDSVNAPRDHLLARRAL